MSRETSIIYTGGEDSQTEQLSDGYSRLFVSFQNLTTDEVTVGVTFKGRNTPTELVLEAGKTEFVIDKFPVESITFSGASAGTYPITLYQSVMDH
jgi:hypothetical protein